MLAVLFAILFALMLLIVIPDRWHARREIAKRQQEYAARTLASLQIESAERWRRPGGKGRKLN